MVSARRPYDAVVVGAGHNGMVLAAYLQRAGLRTLLVERESSVGGMTRTTEPMLPGFKHNPHANFLAYQSITPIVSSLRLAEHGLATITPEIQHGIAFADGRPPVIVHRAGHDEATARSFARHSAKDAKTWLELRPRIDALKSALRDVLFHPLSTQRIQQHRDAVERAFGDLGVTRSLGQRGAAAIVDELFESDSVRTLFHLLATEYGASLTEPGNDLAFLSFTLWMVGNRQVPLGGMQNCAAALERAARAEGVEVMTSAPLAKIRVESGRVDGVELADEFVSARIVASSIGVEQTLGLVGEKLGNADEQMLISYRARKAPTIASQAFALNAPPSYKSAKWDADINACIQTFIGFEGTGDVRAHESDLARGLLPAARASVRVPSLQDPGLAPGGRHVAGADSHFPDPGTLTHGEWRTIEESYNDALLQTWRAAAPNMTPDNVLASHFAKPQAGDRQVLLRDGGSQYATSIEGLYLCGTSTFPGGGVHGACAINAFQDITGKTLS